MTRRGTTNVFNPTGQSGFPAFNWSTNDSMYSLDCKNKQNTIKGWWPDFRLSTLGYKYLCWILSWGALAGRELHSWAIEIREWRLKIPPLFFKCLRGIKTIPLLTGDFAKPAADRHSSVAPHKSINVPSCKIFVSSLIWKRHLNKKINPSNPSTSILVFLFVAPSETPSLKRLHPPRRLPSKGQAEPRHLRSYHPDAWSEHHSW